MTTFLKQFDLDLFFLINGAHTPWSDHWVWIMTHAWFWTPLFLLSIWALWKEYGNHSWMLLLLVILTVGLTDIISSGIIKPVVQRLRPTHTPELFDRLRFFVKPDGKIYYGGRYSFPSSHAANSFTFAMTLFLLIKPKLYRPAYFAVPLITFVLLFSYTRPYLGVHYPSDILAGWVIGFFLSSSSYFVARKLKLVDFF